MRLAINLAKNKKNLTGLNPSVGMFIVKNNNNFVVWIKPNIGGRPHAETIAINNCKIMNLNNSTLFFLNLVTIMEKHHLVQIIVKSKLKKVYYSNNDNDIRTSNKSFSF